MMNIIKPAVLIYFCSFIVACKSKPQRDTLPDMYRVPTTDTTILGTWRAAEDTNRHNFIVFSTVACYYDCLLHFKFQHYSLKEVYESCFVNQRRDFDSVQLYAIYAIVNDDTAGEYLRYKKRLMEAANEKEHFNIMDRYNVGIVFSTSRINGDKVFNFPNGFFRYLNSIPSKAIYRDSIVDTHVRVLYQSATNDTLILAVIADNTLWGITDSVAFCRKIKQNFSNPSYYSDTLHLYKVNTYYADTDSAFAKADTTWHLYSFFGHGEIYMPYGLSKQ